MSSPDGCPASPCPHPKIPRESRVEAGPTRRHHLAACTLSVESCGSDHADLRRTSTYRQAPSRLFLRQRPRQGLLILLFAAMTFIPSANHFATCLFEIYPLAICLLAARLFLLGDLPICFQTVYDRDSLTRTLLLPFVRDALFHCCPKLKEAQGRHNELCGSLLWACFAFVEKIIDMGRTKN